MKQKAYERTGIKEKNQKRESQEAKEKKLAHDLEVQRSVEKGLYRSQVEGRYDVTLMNRDREYEKARQVLAGYIEFIDYYDENVQTVIEGYQAYWEMYGCVMTPVGLRAFRNGINKTIARTKEEMEAARREKQEETILDFYVNYGSLVDERGMDHDLPTFFLEEYLFSKGVSLESIENVERAKTRVKAIQSVLKGKN